jgi:hypothetical protein
VTLAEALEPLYRSYLRRLSEMVARLPEGAALTERSTRGGDGRLVRGDDGLPLRFDVADARDGHTYEVHGARPDSPAAEAVRVGRLDVLVAPGNWEELQLSCVFAGAPPAEDAEDLAELLRGFALFAWYGGFPGAIPPWKSSAHSVRVQLAGNELRASFDLGTCPPSGVEQLCRALSGFCDERLPMACVRIGGSGLI